ncbi:cyclin-domain-containing protein [Gilbertella persicaria]|uniref:cyclin-domain-containing protein n=1 Tax=Gilbertella persicaria TaxID=101096 RepID=UPI00221F4382|nr:cyclin-domain-containing protein [Gilbertella persicaria]KAI8049445.1 cyclin-domain-containing protein [Gilbertella persicaria]
MANGSFGVQSTSQLAEFASSMVYLMWHARKTTKTSYTPPPPPPSLVGNDLAFLMWQARKPIMTKAPYSPLGGDYHSFSYTASPAFKKFCYQVLTATQLKESAVYLSLKYIAILLQSNPSIEGAEGSEYRLFIVALMLANKFLDDNTFTNKTWSDVSGMKVHDLNIMEAEFLEALDYNLFVRQHEYDNWRHLLEECRDRAQMSYYDNPQQRQQLILMTLQTLGLYSPPQPPIQPLYRYSLTDYQPTYQHFSQPQQPKIPIQLPYVMQPPVGYNNNGAYDYPAVTNLSQSSWDPLAYSLNRCQDLSYYSSSTHNFMSATRPISWRNYT